MLAQSPRANRAVLTAIEEVEDFACRIRLDKGLPESEFYDVVVIAIGYGYEREITGENQSYWAPLRLPGPLSRESEPLLFISGNGDGGLVDFNMAAFNRWTHSDITNFLTAYEGLNETKELLLEIEQRAWMSPHEELDIFEEYRRMPLPKNLLRDVREKLRPGVDVWLHTREPRLFRRATAILSRFAAFLAIAADEKSRRGLIHS